MSKTVIPPFPKIPNLHQIKILEWPWKYAVKSTSQPTLTRMVDLETQSCDCPAGVTRKECKHLAWARSLHAAIWKRIVADLTNTDSGWAFLRHYEAIAADRMKEEAHE